MRCIALVAVVLGACTEDTPPTWRLDHDRIVAVRFDPPHITAGQVARIVGLVASEQGGTQEVDVRGASAPFAPGGLFTVVHYNIDHWQIDGATDEALDPARAALSLPAGAPVPIAVTLELAGPLYAEKVIWLGDERPNPPPPVARLDGAPLDGEARISAGATVELLIEADDTMRVRWLTSCGELDNDDESLAELRVDAPCDGELVAVLRDDAGGVSWRVWPLHAQ